MSTKELIRRGESLPVFVNDFFRSWDPLFDFNGGSMYGGYPYSQMPAANIADRPDHYEVTLAVPGMKKSDFTISVSGNTLTVGAEKTEEKELQNGHTTRKEFNYSTFSRSFTLPEFVNKDKIDASYENGLLRLQLPKTEDAKKMVSKSILVK